MAKRKSASAFYTEGCGRQRQQGKEGMCCRCWRGAKGLPPWPQRAAGVPASSPLAAGAGQTGETLTVAASKPDPLAEAWSELAATGVPPDALLAPPVVAPVRSGMCRHCRARWAQQYGLCFVCARELAAAAGCASVRQYLEAEHLARENARIGHLRPVLVPREERELVVDGVAFMVRGLSVRPLAEGELERELAAARNPTGWAAGGSPWSRTQKR